MVESAVQVGQRAQQLLFSPGLQVYSGERWQVLPTAAGASPPMTDEILTLPEVAQLLKVAEKTVYTMAQKGELPAFKVGGQWRFRRVDLDAWIDAKTRRAAGEEEPK